MIDHITDALIEASDKLKRVSNVTHRCVAANCLIKSQPSFKSESVSELLFGEGVELLAQSDAWLQIACDIDGYIGWVPKTALRDAYQTPSHIILAPSAHIYERPDLKSQPVSGISMGSELIIGGQVAENRFLKTSSGWIFKDHVLALGINKRDPVALARSFLGTPYLWGGRSYAGLDCSALIQLPLKICGHYVPRDSSMQFQTLGRLLDEGEKPEYGDIAFFPGHVGWMVDANNVLHANATHMAVTIDPLSDVIDWVAAETDKTPFLGFRRLI